MFYEERVQIFLCSLIIKTINFLAYPISYTMKSLHKKGYQMSKLRFKSQFPSLSDKEIDFMVTQNFYNYSIYYLEIIFLPLMIKFIRYFINDFDASYSNIKECFKRANDKGIIVTTAHFGNWDLGSFLIASAARECNKEAFAVVEPIKPNWLFNFFKRIRKRVGLEIIPLNKATAIKSLKELRNGNVIALVVDRNLTNHGIKTNFFGRECIFNDGPSILIKKTNPKFYVAGLYKSNNKYQVYFNEIEYKVESSKEEITNLIINHIENLVKISPTQWFVFQPNWIGDDYR